uniref:Uncharacterized protein n=1 Tax=Caulerpa lentillifera TaxID=148947 RepID=A0A345HH14_9CHLO|nr:hypothetical protein [Caulerpa lentillifera]AXG75904.1 hypothetical protein [Caulerpa lentillifera]QKS32310.1 hypothetical protein [Caulerpa lentillifera]QUV75607.1 hypothetical protein [Caulerpa lentillifera]
MNPHGSMNQQIFLDFDQFQLYSMDSLFIKLDLDSSRRVSAPFKIQNFELAQGYINWRIFILCFSEFESLHLGEENLRLKKRSSNSIFLKSVASTNFAISPKSYKRSRSFIQASAP